jgi:hypothetical protein
MESPPSRSSETFDLRAAGSDARIANQRVRVLSVTLLAAPVASTWLVGIYLLVAYGGAELVGAVFLLAIGYGGVATLVSIIRRRWGYPPVSVTVSSKGLTFEFSSGSPRSLSWNELRYVARLLDARGDPRTPKALQLTLALFPGFVPRMLFIPPRLPWTYLTWPAFESILRTAKLVGTPMSPQMSSVGLGTRGSAVTYTVGF